MAREFKTGIIVPALKVSGGTPGLGKVLTSDATGNTSWTTPSGGAGDVVGPSSSTDNAIARFDSTTGKLIQNSLVTVTDGGSILATAGFVGNSSAAATVLQFSGVTDPYLIYALASTDNVGIGTNTPTAGYKLEVAGPVLANRYIPKIASVSSASTTTLDASAYSQFNITALATNTTIAAMTGTLLNGDRKVIRIKDNGTARTLTWNSVYRPIGVTLPTTTVISKTLYIGMIYNSTDSKWDVIAVSQEA